MNHRFLPSIVVCSSLLSIAGCSSGVTNGNGGGSNPNPASSFAFYVSGIEGINGGPNFYVLAGSIAIDSTTGNVVDGEQDYNDAVGITAANVTISGGTLTVDSTTGQGTLTLRTSDANLGSKGTETFAVQFVNSKHALIMQFDGSATSSGSLDLQTLPSTLTGGFSFMLTGFDSGGNSLALGGVFSVSNGRIPSGEFDFNDAGDVSAVTGQPLTGTISGPDSFGRGTMTPASSTGLPTIVYYVVGSEAMRMIDMDKSDVLIGSAFGQGAGAFNANSLGSSVFGIAGGPAAALLYAAAGRFSTTPTASPAAFSGVGDDDEQGTVASGAAVAGTYTISSNGYGRMSFGTALQDISALGVYMIDPQLNLNDPNNATGGLGGALIVDLIIPGGIGTLVPQTDTTSASFAGNYAFGAQDFFGSSSGQAEFDFVGKGSVASGSLSGSGDLNDLFGGFSTTSSTDTGISFSGTATADGVSPGRYTMNPVNIQLTAGTPNDFTVVVYQASGDRLFWLDEDNNSLWLGPLERQPTNPTFPSAKTRH